MSSHDNVMDHRTLDERVVAAEIVRLRARLARAESIIAEKDSMLADLYKHHRLLGHQDTVRYIGAALALTLDEEQE